MSGTPSELSQSQTLLPGQRSANPESCLSPIAPQLWDLKLASFLPSLFPHLKSEEGNLMTSWNYDI